MVRSAAPAAALLRCSCALWLAAAALAQNSTAAAKPLADYRVCASARTPSECGAWKKKPTLHRALSP